MLDYDMIFARFMLLAGLGREAALPYEPLIRDAAAGIGDRIRPGLDVQDYMSRLCGAAAAKALVTYRLMEAGGQIRVGDITLDGGDSLAQAREILDQSMAEAACCLMPECGLRMIGDPGEEYSRGSVCAGG